MTDKRHEARQRVETIARSIDDPAVKRLGGGARGSAVMPDDPAGRHTLDSRLRRADQALAGPRTLRDLAVWYRSFAERAGNPTIWEARLRTAEDLDAEADRIEQRLSG